MAVPSRSRRAAFESIPGQAADTVVAGVRPPVRSVRVVNRVNRFSDYAMSNADYATGWGGDVTVKADTFGRDEVLTGR